MLPGVSGEGAAFADAGGVDGAADAGVAASPVSGLFPITCSRLATAEGMEFV